MTSLKGLGDVCFLGGHREALQTSSGGALLWHNQKGRGLVCNLPALSSNWV